MLIRLVDDPFNILKIKFIWGQRIFIDQWQLSICVRCAKSIKFCKRYRLYNGKSLLCSCREIITNLVFSQLMKHFPSCIAKPEEWPALFGYEVAMVFT